MEKVAQTYSLKISGLSPAAYIAQLSARNIRVSERALSMFERITDPARKRKVVTVVYTVAELGLRTNTRLPRIFDKARDLGLGLCTWEITPELLLNHPKLELSSFLRIAMEPIEIPEAGKCIFTIGSAVGSPMVLYNFATPDLHWKLDQRFLFIKK